MPSRPFRRPSRECPSRRPLSSVLCRVPNTLFTGENEQKLTGTYTTLERLGRRRRARLVATLELGFGDTFLSN